MIATNFVRYFLAMFRTWLRMLLSPPSSVTRSLATLEVTGVLVIDAESLEENVEEELVGIEAAVSVEVSFVDEISAAAAVVVVISALDGVVTVAVIEAFAIVAAVVIPTGMTVPFVILLVGVVSRVILTSVEAGSKVQSQYSISPMYIIASR
jgi:hypothetical protein